MTNYEKVKDMSIGEMARILCDNTNCIYCKFYDICCGIDEEVNGYRKWLESEVEA